MEIEIFRDLASLAPYAQQWNSLLADAPTNTVFQTYEWNRCWWEAFGEGSELMVIAAKNQGKISGLAPLMINQKRINGLPETVLQFVGADNHAADYCDFLVPKDEPQVLSAILEQLRRSCPAWTIADFSHLPEESSSTALIVDFFRDNGPRCDLRLMSEAPTFVLGDAAEEAALLNKKSFKRHHNFFQRNGDLEFRVLTSIDEIRAALEVFFEQHSARWKSARQRAIFDDGTQRNFYRKLAESGRQASWLHFSQVLFNNAPIAFHFGFEYAGRLIWYKPSFDPSFAAKSPGDVLLRFLFQYALQHGLKELDFTIGTEKFKYRFANKVRRVNYVRAYRRTLSYRLTQARRVAGQLKRFTLYLGRFIQK